VFPSTSSAFRFPLPELAAGVDGVLSSAIEGRKGSGEDITGEMEVLEEEDFFWVELLVSILGCLILDATVK
jgi:hypothetical protein